jgi:hypothetical protein
MYHFGPARLQDAPHDVYGCIVTVKQACSRHKSDVVPGFVDEGFH